VNHKPSCSEKTRYVDIAISVVRNKTTGKKAVVTMKRCICGAVEEERIPVEKRVPVETKR